MTTHQLVALAAITATLSSHQLAVAQSGSVDAFDGRWTTTLVCDDVHDKDKLVKGYVFVFDVNIEHGKLEGHYGQLDQPSSVNYAGVVRPDGSVDIIATGRTGDNEYSVGKAARGVAYGYAMRGTFDASSGHATRTSVRPCQASFAKH